MMVKTGISCLGDKKLSHEFKIMFFRKFYYWKRMLTKRLILILYFGREEWCWCHSLFNAFHLIWLVAYQSSRDRIIALLDCRRACHRHIQHRSIVCIKALLLCLMQSIWNGVHLLSFTPSDRIVCRPLCSKNIGWETVSGMYDHDHDHEKGLPFEVRLTLL